MPTGRCPYHLRILTQKSPCGAIAFCSKMPTPSTRAYGMRLKPEGLSYGLKKCPQDTSLPGLWPGRSFESRLANQKRVIPNGITRFWYARRDSNPQPSEPESDALSIEPLARFSLDIIAVFSRFVKRETEKIFPAGKLEKVNFM